MGRVSRFLSVFWRRGRSVDGFLSVFCYADFGIVGRVSSSTWGAMQMLTGSIASRDYETMALALLTLGATSEDVDTRVSRVPRDFRGSLHFCEQSPCSDVFGIPCSGLLILLIEL
jgi:hypothetical protein